MRAFEILGIVLFRFRLLPRAWAVVLILVNAGSLVFLHTIYGQLNLAAVVAAIVIIVLIHARHGFVRLLGIGHIFWVPMLIWFAFNLPERSQEPALFGWVVLLMICNTVSLVIDASDVARYLSGERAPHYTWRLPEPNEKE